MKLSYAICVCNESRDLFSLVSFLLKVKDEEDEINILIDTAHVTENVKTVIEYFGDKIVTCEKDFDGNFAEHRNFHLTKCSGDYIFIIDPDEMPKENLIINLKKMINDLENQVKETPKEIEKIVEVEKEVPVEVEKAATGDLREAARLMATSELNKEDLTEKEIFDLLQKSSEEDVRRKIGFWAQPLPTDTDDSTNKIYISKK